jgi:anti-sigma regulatory factor (Ser/Thr protein kinase)
MKDINTIITTISKEIEDSFSKIIPNENQYNLIKNDFKIYPEDPKSLSIIFSTRYFTNPFKISFIQKFIKLILQVMTLEINVINDILIAIDEAVSNIIEHSYKTKIGAVVSFKMTFSPRKLIIMIDDYGKKGLNFNLYNAGNYKTIKELQETAKKTGGGMGIFLIKKIMDVVIK